MPVGQIGIADVALQQFDRDPEPLAARGGAGQHGGAEVDPGDPRAGRVEGHVAPGADPGVQDTPR